MDAKEISAFLTPPKMTGRETLLSLTGGGIALLLVVAGTSFYKRDYRRGILCFLVATLLGFFPFHPSFPGLVLLLGSAAALYLTIRWQYKKYPYLSFRHVHTLFEGEEAMAAENARIEAEARELIKKRPYGPWLFR